MFNCEIVQGNYWVLLRTVYDFCILPKKVGSRYFYIVIYSGHMSIATAT